MPINNSNKTKPKTFMQPLFNKQRKNLNLKTLKENGNCPYREQQSPLMFCVYVIKGILQKKIQYLYITKCPSPVIITHLL